MPSIPFKLRIGVGMIQLDLFHSSCSKAEFIRSLKESGRLSVIQISQHQQHLESLVQRTPQLCHAMEEAWSNFCQFAVDHAGKVS